MHFATRSFSRSRRRFRLKSTWDWSDYEVNRYNVRSVRPPGGDHSKVQSELTKVRELEYDNLQGKG